MNNSVVDKSKKIINFLRLLAIVFIIGSLFMPFATGLKMTVKTSSENIVTTYKNAYSFIFGGRLVSEHVTYTTSGCSLLGIISIAFLLLSLVEMFSSLFVSNKRPKLSKIFLLCGFFMILTGSIMLLCMHSSAASILADAITGKASDAIKNTIYNNTSLSIGFIGAAIFGLTSALILIFSFFLDGTIDKIRAAIEIRTGL